MRSSDDGDDELEVESELTGMPVTKRKATSSPSSLNRSNKAPRLGLSQPSALGNRATGGGSSSSNRNRFDNRSAGSGPSRTQPRPNVLRDPPRSTTKHTSSEVVEGSSPDELEESLTQLVRRRLLASQTKGKERAREVRQVEVPIRRVARKQVGNRPRVSTESLLKGAQKNGKSSSLTRCVQTGPLSLLSTGESTARTRIRPKKRRAFS